MNTLSRSEFKILMEQQDSLCISIFLPTHRKAGIEMQQDQLRLRNLLREAEHLLLVRNIDTTQVEALLEPIAALFTEEEIWQHPDDGLAILRTPELLRYYQLPSHFKEQVRVGDHFYLKPLLPFLTSDGYFYILALSKKEIRLLEATCSQVREVNLPASVPANLAEAIKYDEAENVLQYHSSASTGTASKGGRQPVIFHGQGVGSDDEKQKILRYFQQIDRGLHEFFHDKTTPLVLAGVEFLLPIYREANTYPSLIPEGILGNPDKLRIKNETLCKQAWPIVESSVLKKRQDALAQFEEYKETDRASSNVSAIVPKAYMGCIESLFLAVDQEQWGTFDPATYTFHAHETAEPGDEDLLDLVASQTILYGGTVYATEQKNMPDKALLAAVYRY
jgi:hypothetical protein